MKTTIQGLLITLLEKAKKFIGSPKKTEEDQLKGFQLVAGSRIHGLILTDDGIRLREIYRIRDLKGHQLFITEELPTEVRPQDSG